MYVDSASGRTNLVYLPVLGQEEHTDYVRFFKGIITNVITDPSEDGTYISKLLNYLNATENFSLADFSKLIKRLKASSVSVQEVRAERKENRVPDVQKSVEKPSQRPPVRKPAPQDPAGKPEHKPVTGEVNPKKKVQPAVKEEKPIKKESSDQYTFDIPGKSQPKKTVQPASTEKQAETEGEDNISMLQLLRNFSGENLEKYKNQKQNKGKQKPEKKMDEKEDKKAEKIAEEKADGKGKEKRNERKPVQASAPTLTLISLDPQNPLTFVVNKEEYRIGRRDTNDAVIRNMQSISREHCVIVREQGEYYVIDHSKFGTRVDGVSCVSGQKGSPLHDHSVIEFPEISFRVEIR